MNFIVFIIVWSAYDTEVLSQSHTNFWVKSFDVCETNGPVKFDGNVVTENRKQYLNFDLNSPVAMDNNMGLTMDIESLLSNKTCVHLFTIREKSFCEAFNKYLGEFWYDIERAGQVIPGACPIAAGRYHVHHMLLDFKKMTLQTFPFGTLKLTTKGIDKRNKRVIFCVVMVVENIPA